MLVLNFEADEVTGIFRLVMGQVECTYFVHAYLKDYITKLPLVPAPPCIYVFMASMSKLRALEAKAMALVVKATRGFPEAMASIEDYVNNNDNVYGAVKVIARVHRVHLINVNWLPAPRPSQLTWAVSLPKIGCYHPLPPYSALKLILILPSVLSP